MQAQVLHGIGDLRLKTVERLALQDLPKGLAIMRDKTEDYVKIMVEN